MSIPELLTAEELELQCTSHNQKLLTTHLF